MSTLPGENKKRWVFHGKHDSSEAVMCDYHADKHN